MISHSFFITAYLCLFLITLSATSSVASPLSSEFVQASRQTTTVQPYFPDTPPSCPICAKGYPSINSCAQAAPALANLTSVCVHYLRTVPIPKVVITRHHYPILKGHFQPRGVHRRDQVHLHRHFQIYFPAVCRLVRTVFF
jgi:hypothetical protein